MVTLDILTGARNASLFDLRPRLGVNDLMMLRGAVDGVPAADVARVLAEEGVTTGDTFETGPGGRTIADPRFRDLLGQTSWSRAEARQLQTGLNERGFASGTVDGIVGPVTRGAIDRARAADGGPTTEGRTVTDERFSALLGQTSWTRSEGRELQTGLNERGHDAGTVDGIVGPNTRAAMARARGAAAEEAPPPPPAAAEVEADGAVVEPGDGEVTGPRDGPQTVTDERFSALIGQTRWTTDEARELQTGLNQRGYDTGEVDGQVGPATREALRNARAAVATPAMADGAPQPTRPGDAWVAIYPDYDITIPEDYQGIVGERMQLGHADIVTFEDSPGGSRRATLHQFGRYNGAHGQVRTHQIPIDLEIDPATGDLTAGSRDELLAYLSREHGHGSRVEVTEVENVDLDRVDRFVDGFRQESAAGGRAYDIWDNNCTTFAWEAAHAGTVDASEREELEGRGRRTLPGWSNWGMGDFMQYEYTP